MPIKHPYDLPPKRPVFLPLVHPATAGVLGVLALRVRPGLLNPLWSLTTALSDYVPGVASLETAHRWPLTQALVGFIVGYMSYRGVDWVRWRVLQRLLSYRAWMDHPKAAKTKVWGLLVKCLGGVGPHAGFEFQSVLPKHPLPDLDQTLDKWLFVSKQWLTPEEYEETKTAVQQFRKNEGPKIQEFLANKAKTAPSWLADYWLTGAYLSSRESLAVHSNYYISCGFPDCQPVPDQLSRASLWCYNLVRYTTLVSNDQMQTDMIMDRVPLCMDAYKYLAGSVRLPGPYMDTIAKYTTTHIVVIRNGQFFKMDILAPDSKNGKKRQLTTDEIRKQFQIICDKADNMKPILPVASLTAQKRDVWAKHHDQLEKLNRDVMQAIESAMFMLVLDPQSPKDTHEFIKNCLVGKGNDRWFDKCFTNVTYGNAWNGLNVEHSAFDATAFGQMCEYCSFHEHYENGKPKLTEPPPRTIDPPHYLQWDFTGMEGLIQTAFDQFTQVANAVDCYLYPAIYGKGFMKKQKISPDGYIQMMIQLAFYRRHKEIPKTYEPSTGRLFLLGRTETVHPGSPASVAFLRGMEAEKLDRAECQKLLRAAVKHQTKMRLDATIGRGCDRHLLGLLCASRELGMDIPAIFMDKAWRMSFRLSTSQTPTRAVECGVRHLFFSASGGFGPGCQDGYGVSYIILGDADINIAISSWKSCEETNSSNFAATLQRTMEDMKQLFETS